MKKILAILLSIFTVTGSIAFADVTQGNTKNIDTCAVITNTSDYPDLTFLHVQTKSFFHQQKITPTLVKDGDCVNFLSTNSDVMALKTSYWEEQSTNNLYDPYSDPNAYGINFGSEPPLSQIDKNSNLVTAKYYYEITGMPAKKDLGFVNLKLIKKETNLETFTDVQVDNPYYKEISYMKFRRYINGYYDGSYKPDNLINRAEFTKIVMGSDPKYRDIVGTPNLDCGIQTFNDVSTASDNWYRDPVCNAHDLGIITGYPDKTFKPEQHISFAEASKIILKAKGVWSDVAPTTTWYTAYTNFFEQSNSVPDRIKDYNEPITRGEMALMIYTAETSPLSH